MTLRHMRIFAEVYRTRNVTHAAQNLHMTQPAVTRAIQELEQHYGVRLFERLYRHLSPTEAAQRLYAQAVYLLDTFDHMEAAMRDWDSLGVVRVGATVTLGSTILPVLARRFAALYPGIELHAIDGLITNFHLPESTLIMLIAAFYGYDKTMAAYKVAVEQKYRFFSFGDAMFIR